MTTQHAARRMLPSAGSSSRAEETAILEEARAVSSVRGAAGGRGDGAAAGRGRGRGNTGRARDARPESPTRGEDEQTVEGGTPCLCVGSFAHILFDAHIKEHHHVPPRLLRLVTMSRLLSYHAFLKRPTGKLRRFRSLIATLTVTEPAEEPEAPLLEGVRLLALDSHEDAQAWSPPPGFVVMYDPDIAFIRQLEVRPEVQGFHHRVCSHTDAGFVLNTVSWRDESPTSRHARWVVREFALGFCATSQPISVRAELVLVRAETAPTPQSATTDGHGLLTYAGAEGGAAGPPAARVPPAPR